MRESNILRDGLPACFGGAKQRGVACETGKSSGGRAANPRLECGEETRCIIREIDAGALLFRFTAENAEEPASHLPEIETILSARTAKIDKDKPLAPQIAGILDKVTAEMSGAFRSIAPSSCTLDPPPGDDVGFTCGVFMGCARSCMEKTMQLHIRLTPRGWECERPMVRLNDMGRCACCRWKRDVFGEGLDRACFPDEEGGFKKIYRD